MDGDVLADHVLVSDHDAAVSGRIERQILWRGADDGGASYHRVAADPDVADDLRMRLDPASRGDLCLTVDDDIWPDFD